MTDLQKHTVAQLRSRRRRLARTLGNPETTLFGALLTQGRKCGKEGCRCAAGELHGPYVYVALRKQRGRSGLLYVPAELADAVRDRIELTAQMQAVSGRDLYDQPGAAEPPPAGLSSRVGAVAGLGDDRGQHGRGRRRGRAQR
jgi:uncharacterized protein DUF6788